MVDKNGKPDIQAALAAFKEGFARKIPARVDEIRQSWKKLKSTPEDPDTFQLLHRQAHTLAGTSATYGFEETGRLARAIEITLQDELTEDHTIWTATAVDKVGALLVQLESVAESEPEEKDLGMEMLQSRQTPEPDDDFDVV
jgi:chemotaxis protein histidine kinase CheA